MTIYIPDDDNEEDDLFAMKVNKHVSDSDFLRQMEKDRIAYTCDHGVTSHACAECQIPEE